MRWTQLMDVWFCSSSGSSSWHLVLFSAPVGDSADADA